MSNSIARPKKLPCELKHHRLLVVQVHPDDHECLFTLRIGTVDRCLIGMLIQGEPERAPNTRETGSVFIYSCGDHFSENTLGNGRHMHDRARTGHCTQSVGISILRHSWKR